MADSFMSFEITVNAFWTQWWISVAVVASLTLQLLLLLTGTARRWNRYLRALAWSAYNWSDYIATLALGGMAQNAIDSGKAIYAIWAPILLLHLGAPDNVSAYALEDNELWLRHGLLMIVHVLASMFVVINCAKGWEYVRLSTFLMLAGPIKYAERTLALRGASKAAIAESVFPISNFMLLEPVLNLPIKGIAPLQSSEAIDHESSISSTNLDHYFYIVRGEKQWQRQIQQRQTGSEIQSSPEAFIRAARQTSNFVTLEDILNNPLLSSSPRIRHTCIAFALFKLYRRRFSAIHMHEWQEPKTRHFFLNYSGSRPIFAGAMPETDIMSVLNLELQFIFDSHYTKSSHTAFSMLGILFRVFTTLLLTSSVGMLRSMNVEMLEQDRFVKQARLITILLLVAALFVEICQLVRLLRSDWTTVWLACEYIKLLHKESHSNLGSHRLLIVHVFRSIIAKCLISTDCISIINPSLEKEYRRLIYSINQYAFIDHHLFLVNRSNITQYYESGSIDYLELGIKKHIKPQQNCMIFNCNLHSFQQYRIHQITDPDMLHQFTISVLKDVLVLCRNLSDLVQEPNFYYFAEFIGTWQLTDTESRPWRGNFEQYCVYMARNRDRSRSSESLIVSWHLATMVCEMLDECSNTGSEDLRMSLKMKAKILSSYLLYLLVKKAELLPCHADIGRRTVLDAQRALDSIIYSTYNNYIVISNNLKADSLDLRLLIQTIIMESLDLRIYDHDINSSNTVIGEDVKQVLLEIYKTQSKYDTDRINGCAAANYYTAEEALRVPHVLWPGLMAGKLLVLGIGDRNERWRFIWDFWIEILSSIASVNKSEEHLKELTMGHEFLTHIWVLLGHMGFGKRT